MSQNQPRIDFANLPTPNEAFLATLVITVHKVAASRRFYAVRDAADRQGRGDLTTAAALR